ncbi:lytic transglycosylase domain-containing protein [Acidisphaera sp. S103]|uniref:lytic transglycosylase domain-containing protein n=1 Tax=Acidisphaera sp. S103 TaxID=1747223 RepID=UPI00131E1FA6|nr:lytic transglycosylase domain-containing protein [Acidisphaera sp. S103]
MTILTVPAAIALALSCNIPRPVVPVIVGIARHESGLNTAAINHDANGTIDAGLAQVNSSNWGWLGIHSLRQALDPCTNLRGGVRVLLARYNGNGSDVSKMIYAASVLAGIPQASGPASVRPTPPIPSNPFTKPSRTDREIAFTVERK